ncbi:MULTISPECIES: response regulator transcription factor [Glutamicibacter]|jgi:DNA-binding NarL/FixJ family response regulator|uniref:Response regulator transcription factor n=3 Tax=Glutamicibacter arilaitensis TaxID=256701 RepID=A0A4Y8TXP6_9MICC|nr:MULTISPECIES: response regulator transcription factor [Glutamicibacter]TFH56037.1 response regulator transcription factor [Glutamicibacter arilaitensis]CBT77284.1 two-component system response regulator [Glutamicibacter arilaitensis Re117]HCH48763.1 DNA-binding response regulator [Glutamicibacter sp.]
MRVLICEDSVLLREGLVRLLDHSGHRVVADLPEASGLMPFLDSASEEDFPQICILDVRLPPTYTDEGIRAALEVRKKYPDLPLLVLSQYVEERYASELISTRSGAIGYLLKDRVADVSEFVASLEQIAAGGTILDQEVVAQLLTRRNHDDRMQRLTDRERTVLAAVAEGKSNQAIAALLFLSEASVEKYITSIFQKLGLEADGTGNRRVLAALAHIQNLGTTNTDRTES